MLRILVVHASFGKGHQKAAQAIGEYFNISPYDLLDFSSNFLKNIYILGYKLSTQYFPFIWRMIFCLSRSKKIGFSIGKIQEKIFASFLGYLRQAKPQLIIATHFFPASLSTSLKNEWDFKIASVVTDLRAHPLWADKGVDYYFTALDITKKDLVKQGIEEHKIISGVVPLRKGFLKKNEHQEAAKQFFGKQKPIVLFISALSGNFLFLKTVLKYLLADFNIFVICGKSRRIKKYLKTLPSSQLRFYDFYENIWEMVDCSFVIVSKPGGLTVFEGIYGKKPFIFTGYIPGQEKENMDLLLKHDVARFASTKNKFIEAIYYFKNKMFEGQGGYPLTVNSIERELFKLAERLR